MILTKAVLVQMYSEDTDKHQSDESIFSNLASVDILWCSSMKKYNLRNKIRQLSKVYFQKTKMRSTIIRNNLNFLKEVIHPDRVIFPMKSCGCLTEDQVRFINRLRNDKDKNHELLIMVQDFSSQKYSKMIDCLFLANQTPAALVLQRGGEVVKVHIDNRKAWRTKGFEMEFIKRFQQIQRENTLILDGLLQDSVRKRLNGVFLLHAKQNEGIEIWFWCKTESSLNELKCLSDDDMREIIQRIYQQLIPEHKLNLQLIQMNYSLASDFVERRLSIRHVGDREVHNYANCVASLADRIYITCKGKILVYENKYPYYASETIEFGHEGSPVSITTCNINKCLYIYGSESHIFKVEPELDNRVSQWLSGTGASCMSVTSKGDVLVLQVKSGGDMLKIFTPKGTVKRTISMQHSLDKIKLIQEIMPDLVAVVIPFSCIAIMCLDDNGTPNNSKFRIIRHIRWQENQIVGLTFLSYGDLFIGANRYVAILHDNESPQFIFNSSCVVLHQWPFELYVARDLITTNKRIKSIHFATDQKQLYVLLENELKIYYLNYEDEDCCP